MLAENDSPDLGFRFSINPYRGCEHGCIYCYARPSHEYLSFSAGLDFERRIMVKDDAPLLLRAHFLSPRWQPQTVALSGNTDCYQPVERRLQLTRRCLEVFRDFRNPVSVITKSALVARDADLLAELAADGAACANVSITTLDGELARRLEPRAATPERRLEAVAALVAAGVPTGVMVAPVIPGLNDSEIPSILERAAAAGARQRRLDAAAACRRRSTGSSSTGWRGTSPSAATAFSGASGTVATAPSATLASAGGCAARASTPRRSRPCFAPRRGARGLDRAAPPLSADAFRRPPRPGEQLSLYPE